MPGWSQVQPAATAEGLRPESESAMLMTEAKQLTAFEQTVEDRALALQMTKPEFLDKVDEEVQQALVEDKALDGVNAMSKEERLDMAVIYLRDAQGRRDIELVDWTSKAARRAYKLHKHDNYFWVANSFVLLYAALGFWDADSKIGGHSQNNTVLAMEGVCVVALVLDLAVRVTFIGPKHWLGRDKTSVWNVLLSLLVLLSVSDFISQLVWAAGSAQNAPPVRFARPLRLGYLIFHNRQIENCFGSVLRTFPVLADLAIMAIMILTFFAIAGVTIFGNADEFQSPEANNTAAYADSFDTFGSAMISLFVLLTDDNYSSVIHPALRHWGLAWAFFVPFIVLGVYVIMPLLVAVIFDYYKNEHGMRVLQQKALERKAIHAAFEMADVDNSGVLDQAEFRDLLQLANPSMQSHKLAAVFMMLDKDNDQEVDRKEFEAVCDILLLKITESKADPALIRPGCGLGCVFDDDSDDDDESESGSSRRWSHARRCCCCGCRRQLRQLHGRVSDFVRSSVFEITVQILVVSYVVCLVLKDATADDDTGIMTEANFNAVDWVFLGLFAAEMILKLFVYGCNNYWVDPWNRLDGVIVLSSFVGHVVFFVLDSTGVSALSITNLRAARVMKLQKFLRLFRALSLISHSAKLKALITSLNHMTTVFRAIFWVILITTYLYASIAVHFFEGKIGTALQDESCGSWCPSFESLGMSMLTFFQIMVIADWSRVMYGAMDGTSWAACLFFISYVVFVSIVLTNLLGALVLEIYQLEMNRVRKSERGTDIEEKQRLFPNKHLEWSQDEQREQRLQVVLSEGMAKQFNELDSDNSGTISRTELLLLIIRMQEQQSKNAYVNGKSKPPEDGPKSQARRRGRRVAVNVEHEVDQLMLEIDSDGNGTVTYEEFQDWWQKRELERMYKLYDVNGDGSFDKDEFTHLLNDLGVSKPDQVGVFESLDDDGSGVISLDEFMQWWKRFDVHKVFQEYDTDGSGDIDFAELFELVERLGVRLKKYEIVEAVQKLDTDDSGSLSLEEFEPWWRQVLGDRLMEAKTGDRTSKFSPRRLARSLGLNTGGSKKRRKKKNWGISNIKHKKKMNPHKENGVEGGTVIVQERVGERWEDDLFLNHMLQEKEKQDLIDSPFRYELVDDPSAGGYTVHHRTGTLFVREDGAVKRYFEDLTAENDKKRRAEQLESNSQGPTKLPRLSPTQKSRVLVDGGESEGKERRGEEKREEGGQKDKNASAAVARAREQITALETVLSVPEPSLQYTAARTLQGYVTHFARYIKTGVFGGISEFDRTTLQKEAAAAMLKAPARILQKLKSARGARAAAAGENSLLLTIQVHLDGKDASELLKEKEDGPGFVAKISSERRSSVAI